MRTPAEIRKNGNHLVNEASLYLQQHAHNPVDWYPWGETALQRAIMEDKPIFLSIGYSSCHWCHVMEHEVFEVDEVAEFLNKHFISIKVDREERPDLDAVYMQAVQMMTGGGGWPMSVFLTPDLKPFYGGTYFPRDSFLQLIDNINRVYQEQRDKVDEQGKRLSEVIAAIPNLEVGDLPSEDEVKKLTSDVQRLYDPQWGGTNGAMKFPTPLKWHYLLHYYRKTGDEKIAGIVRGTLDQMASGGIFDQVGGGFHRYTVERTWMIPHFEKMLYDNGQMASLYLEAAAVFEDPVYQETARLTLDFLLRDMRGEEGAFYASYDADSGGEEGSFYVWTEEEIIQAVGEKDGRPLAYLLGVTEKGNFEGKTVLSRRISVAETAQKFNRSEDEVRNLIPKYRQELLDYRAGRTWPGLDRKIITSWNGYAIAAMAQGAMVLGDDRYLQAAFQAVKFLNEHHRREDGKLYRTSTGYLQGSEGVLDDYAMFSWALLEVYRASGDLEYLVEARELADIALRDFSNPEGGFYFTGSHDGQPLGRQTDFDDSVEPSGNAVMMQVLLRLSAITGEMNYREFAHKSLASYSSLMKKAGLQMAWWMDALQLYQGPFYELILVSPAGAKKQLGQYRSSYYQFFPYNSVLSSLDEKEINSGEVKSNLPVSGKTAMNGKVTAYVCLFGACKAPVNTTDEMISLLKEGYSF